jgi:hypothetical protein
MFPATNLLIYTLLIQFGLMFSTVDAVDDRSCDVDHALSAACAALRSAAAAACSAARLSKS